MPQLFASPLNFGFGVYSICLHVNTLNEAEVERIVGFVKKNRSRFISFEDATSIRNPVPGVARRCAF